MSSCANVTQFSKIAFFWWNLTDSISSLVLLHHFFMPSLSQDCARAAKKQICPICSPQELLWELFQLARDKECFSYPRQPHYTEWATHSEPLPRCLLASLLKTISCVLNTLVFLVFLKELCCCQIKWSLTLWKDWENTVCCVGIRF